MLIFASAKESSMSTTPGDNRDRTYFQFFAHTFQLPYQIQDLLLSTKPSPV